jgi:hypothetical protein
MTIDKFDPNLILVSINKLKPYRFVEDQTLQPILTKPSDFPLKELIETNHFGNMFIEELVDINHFGHLFIKELVKFHIKGLAINNQL